MIFLCGAATINFTFSFHAYFDYNHLESPCITHLTLRRHFTFHQQRFNSSYPSRQFPIPLKVTIALEIFTHNKPYFIHCRKKKLLAFPDLDSIHLLTCLWRNYPIFGYFKSSCHFDVCPDTTTR
jgi:hypothetical protein